MFYKRENELNKQYNEAMKTINQKMQEAEKENMSDSKKSLYFAALLQETRCNEIYREYRRIHTQNIIISYIAVAILLIMALYVGKTM